jgi:tight adherence protein C
MPSTRVEDFRLEDWLPYWLSADDLIAGLASLAVLVAFVAMWQALRGREAFERRFARIAQQRQNLRQAAVDTRPSRQRMTAARLMSAVVIRLDLLRSQHAQAARTMLARAGIRSNEAMVRYLFARLSMPFVFGLGILADASGPHLLPVPEHLRMFAALGGAVLGFYAPGAFLRNRIQKRVHQIQLGLPDALDLLVICAEAGLSLDMALVRVSRELETTWPELSEEFAITAAELTYLPERNAAFDNLNARTNMASIRGVVNTLLQTAKFGTPLAQSLRVLAAEFREARMTRAEEKAARLPAMLTVPMIVFILPTLFIVVLGPAVISILDTFSGRARNKPMEVTRTVRPGPPEATVVPAQVSVRAGDLVTVDADARALRDGSQHRIVLVPAGTPDDGVDLLRDAVAIAPYRVRVSLPASTPGPNEIRLYYVPPSGSKPQIGARAAVTITSGDG